MSAKSEKLKHDLEQQLIASVFDSSPDALFMVDFTTAEIMRVNKSAIKLFNASGPNDFLGKNGASLHAERWTFTDREKLEAAISAELDATVQILYKKFSGGTFWGDASFKLISHQPLIYLVRVLDITDLKTIKQASEAEQINFKRLIEAMDEGTIQINQEGEIIYANNKFCELVGLTNETVVGLAAAELMFSNEGANPALLSLITIDSKGFKNQYELKYERKDGSTMWLWANGTPMYDDKGNVEGSFVIYNDITDRKESELKLVSAILETQESERSRLAEELHDSLGQILTAVKLNLNALQPASSDLGKTAVYQNLTLLIEQAIQETRNISHNLMPKSLHDFGLAYALEIMFERINKAGKTEILFHLNHNAEGDFQFNINVYRMIQEAINNALKHSKAKKIEVSFNKGIEFDLMIEIADDGRGFDVSRALRFGGLGLRNLIRRAEFVGGSCQIKSQEGKGTKIIFELPL